MYFLYTPFFLATMLGAMSNLLIEAPHSYFNHFLPTLFKNIIDVQNKIQINLLYLFGFSFQAVPSIYIKIKYELVT